MKWQPIKTAPTDKDGTLILGAIALRKTKAGHQIGGEIQIIFRHGHEWTKEMWVKRNGDQFFPTHWMPLPKPPESVLSEKESKNYLVTEKAQK